MQAEILNPFFQEFMKRIMNIIPEDRKAVPGDFIIKKEMYTGYDISLLVEMSGDANGRIVMSMEPRVSLELSETMMGSPVDSFEKQAQSAISELLNIIIGNALTQLSDKNYDIRFSPVSLFFNKRIRTNTKEVPIAVTQHISCEWGGIELNLALMLNSVNPTN